MKYLIAIVPGPAIDLVTRSFGAHEIFRITVSEVEVLGVPPEEDSAEPERREAGPRQFGALDEDDDRRLRIEVAVNDAFVPLAIEALRAVEEGGFSIQYQLLPIDDAVHIRTGDRGPDAI